MKHHEQVIKFEFKSEIILVTESVHTVYLKGDMENLHFWGLGVQNEGEMLLRVH